MLADAPVHAEDVAYREIDGEIVVVSASKGRIYSLTKTGSFVWQRADGRRTVSDIVEEMCRTFEVERGRAAEDTTAFIEELRAEGLLCRAEEEVVADAS